MKMVSKYGFALAGVVIGALAGYAYYYFIGCASGTCAITSHPLNSSIYGAVMGTLLFTSIKKDRKNKEQKNEQ